MFRQDASQALEGKEPKLMKHNSGGRPADQKISHLLEPEGSLM
jgi:hypothetical protein